ncbi:MAG: hypothetical protein COV91_03045 [Candidatus Taylorbacteria bacterium CG11_big_fil_rev_8_21_14_0_20_46_11]|uniref:Uncharacterized protein n=1 Tax=Candidatus Taylorbacteria bacterium CG11_big_fil_rev_8_21_14_0_20_46_11 TaxID=1975025 RepID=A0A2H0KBL0_9BACT|nr:MAG: hypothetical protein COV91_03045 [Candidatus Taylorbacteria bacterium CG11_big_fil_rev_8_21_14_0_20_46_11]
MSKTNLQNRRTVLRLSGALSTNWAMLGKKVLEKGGMPEDLGILGEPENPATIKMVNNLAIELVALGNQSRASRSKTQSPAAPSMMFKPVLTPKYLFVLPKNGADAPTLLSAMEGTYPVSPHARGMMGQTQHFIIGPSETALVGVFSSEQLDVVDWAETYFFGPKGWEHVKKFNLAKCLPDDGPYVRIAHPEQELGESFRVGCDPISFDGYSDVWCVGHNQSLGRYLLGWDLHPSHRLVAGDLIALRLAR